MVPPAQTTPPSESAFWKRTAGTSVFQATQPPSSSAALAVFSLESRDCCTNQPNELEGMPPSLSALVRSVSVSVCRLYVVRLEVEVMRGRLVKRGGSKI